MVKTVKLQLFYADDETLEFHKAQEELWELQKEVRSEPKMALYGGVDGLDFYRRIVADYVKKLKIGGMIAVEIGLGQENSVSDIFRENGLQPRLEKDLCGVYRVVYSIK